MKLVFLLFTLIFSLQLRAQKTKSTITIVSKIETDLANVLHVNGYDFILMEDPLKAVKLAKVNSGVIFVANDYPSKRLQIDEKVFDIANKKKLRLFIEYPGNSKTLSIGDSLLETRLERGIILSNKIKNLDSLDLFAIHNASVIKVNKLAPLVIIGKVSGFDNAQFGISDIEKNALLYIENNKMIATTKLSNSITSRFGPVNHIKPVWEYIFSWLSPSVNWSFNEWPIQVSPSFEKQDEINQSAYVHAIEKGIKWFYNGRFFVDSSWNQLFLERQGDGSHVTGPPLDQSLPNGNGTLGVLEGHLSGIQMDGSQIYRYWMRADCNAEVAFALSTLKDEGKNGEIASNLLDYIYKGSNLRGGNRSEPQSPTFGLVGWSTTHPHVYYGDDNARVILGAMGASARLGTDKWDKFISETIVANFRTTGKNGFRGGRLEDADIQKNGLSYYTERDLISPHPHFESWMWAIYLWFYDKTGHKPFLEQAKKAIEITMESYPNWKWTNGIQQERARMILPLAWLVRIEDTKKHRAWLSLITDKVLENMDESGAIREELGSSSDGMFGATKTNADYGMHEAPLIAENGDPVADMLYTTNFGFFALNEAAVATHDPKYINAVNKIAGFLVKVQVRSEVHPDLDGAWFRAFDYKRWEYWASNADAGWGAWGTLTGWTQSWIIATLALKQEKSSLWDLTKDSKIKDEALPVIQEMLKN